MKPHNAHHRILTTFEQAAYDEQFRVRSRHTGPALASSFEPDVSFTKSDRDLLISLICLAAFVALLVHVHTR